MAEKKKYSFDIDKALDSIDLTFGGYRPSKDALDFFNVMRLVQGEDFEFSSPLAHYWLVDLLLGNIGIEHYPYSEEVKSTIKINNKRIAIMASRGLAKSTVVTTFFPIYCAIKGSIPNFGQVYFQLAVAASTQGGARVMCKAIQSMCEDSVFCQNYFESMRFTETESEFVRKGSTKADKRTYLFRAMGFSSGIRGTRSNVGAHRPDMILFDDVILNTAAAYSETIMTTLTETINADAINALKGGGKGKIFMVFTPFHMRDPNVLSITSGAYTPVALPICEKIEDDMTEEEFVGAWPAMHPYEAVMEQWEQAVASNSTRAFNQERMLRISSDEDRMISDEMIQWYCRKDMKRNLEGNNIYITTDFTTTSEAKSDFSALSVWAVNSNQDFFLLDLCVRKQGLQEQYDELFRMVNFWGREVNRSITVGVEIDGQQKAHVFSLKEQMIKRNEWFIFARNKGAKPGSEGILSKSSGGNKHERFRLMLPRFQNKKIWFPEELKGTPDMTEALRQLKYTTWANFGAHDDFIDTVSQLGLMEIIYPIVDVNAYSAIGTKRADIWGDEYEQEEPDAYASYT